MSIEAQTIPKDIHDSAMRAVDAAREDFLLAKISDNQWNLRKVAIACIEKVILAERERCVREIDYFIENIVIEVPGRGRFSIGDLNKESRKALRYVRDRITGDFDANWKVRPIDNGEAA